MSLSRRRERIARRRGQKWAELLLENGRLRSNLNDDEAKAVLDWGLAQLQQATANSSNQSAEEAETYLEKYTTAVKLIIEGVNELVDTVGKPLNFDIIDDTMTRLLKNYRWLAGQILSPVQSQQLSHFNDAREAADRPAAFQALLGLLYNQEYVELGSSQLAAVPEKAPSKQEGKISDKPASDASSVGDDTAVAPPPDTPTDPSETTASSWGDSP